MQIVLLANVVLVSLITSAAAVPFTFTFGRPSSIDVSWRTGPSLDDIWLTIQSEGANAIALTDKIVQEAKTTYTDIAHKIEDFKLHMDQLVTGSAAIRKDLQTSMSAHQISQEDLSDFIAQEMARVVESIKTEFTEPLPEDQDERYKRREKMISFTLDEIEVGFVRTCAVVKIPESEARAEFSRVRPTFQHTLNVAGSIVDRHPEILETVIISAVFMLVPESWFLRPILNVFGFGPQGPVKGSAAAWMQRIFWGAAVREGSWFAALQRAGMTLRGGWG